MENDNYEFELTEEQIRAAIKKYGKEHVLSVYKKLAQSKFSTRKTSKFEGKCNSAVKFDLGNGNYHYKNIRPKGEF